MHLPKLPTVFVKGGEERNAYFTIQARELIQAGWVEKTEEAPKEEPKKVVKEEKAEKPIEIKEEKPKATSRARTVNAKEEADG
jgi:chemotaxis response regulator CheB